MAEPSERDRDRILSEALEFRLTRIREGTDQIPELAERVGRLERGRLPSPRTSASSTASSVATPSGSAGSKRRSAMRLRAFGVGSTSALAQAAAPNSSANFVSIAAFE